jgi:hypothetical protein
MRRRFNQKELPATSSQLKALSWHCFAPFNSSPNGDPLLGERIRQVADFPQLEAGGWKLSALFEFKAIAGKLHTRSRRIFVRLQGATAGA